LTNILVSIFEAISQCASSIVNFIRVGSLFLIL
jgi:hypothetical protein